MFRFTENSCVKCGGYDIIAMVIFEILEAEGLWKEQNGAG